MYVVCKYISMYVHSVANFFFFFAKDRDDWLLSFTHPPPPPQKEEFHRAKKKKKKKHKLDRSWFSTVALNVCTLNVR